MNPDYGPKPPEFPLDMEMVKNEIINFFGVSIDRANDLIAIAYKGGHQHAQQEGRFKIEIVNDETHGQVMVITRESSGFQIAIAKTSYFQGIPGTNDKMEIHDARIVQTSEFNPTATVRPNFSRIRTSRIRGGK